MNEYRITHNPGGRWTNVLAPSLEEAVKLFLDTRDNEIEKRISQVETLGRDVLYKNDNTKIREVKENIKKYLTELIDDDIEEYIDNM